MIHKTLTDYDIMPRPKRWTPEDLDQTDPRLYRNMNSGVSGGLIQSLFGPLASPRANPEFDPKTAVETGATPYQKAGIFRRILGDQSDNLNRQFGLQRTGLLIDRAENEYERNQDFDLFSKQQQLADQLAKDRFMLEAGQRSVDAISGAEMENQFNTARQDAAYRQQQALAEAEALNRKSVEDARNYIATQTLLQQASLAKDNLGLQREQMAQDKNRPMVFPQGAGMYRPEFSDILINQEPEPFGPDALLNPNVPRVTSGIRRVPVVGGASATAVNPKALEVLRSLRNPGAGTNNAETVSQPLNPAEMVSEPYGPPAPRPVHNINVAGIPVGDNATEIVKRILVPLSKAFSSRRRRDEQY